MKLSYCTLQYKKMPIPNEQMLGDIASAAIPADPSQAAFALNASGDRRGYDGVEWLITSLEPVTTEQRRKLAAATRALKLEMPVLGSYIGHYNLAMTNRDEVLTTALKSFEIAHEMGTPLIRCFVGFVCECSSINCPADYWKYNVAGFREVAEALQRFNAQHQTIYSLVLETHPQSLVDTVAGCRGFLDDVGSDLLSLNLQFGPDMLRDGFKTYADVMRALRPHIRHVHTQPDTIRKDTEEVAAYKLLAQDGYEGFFSVEGHPPWPEGVTGPDLAKRRLADYMAVGMT